MAEKIGKASGYRTVGGLTRPVFGNAQKGSYGLSEDLSKKSRYSEVSGKRPATFGDYFKDAKDRFEKLKKMASKIDGMSKSPESGATPIDLSQVPKGNPISNLKTNPIASEMEGGFGRGDRARYKTTEGNKSDFRFDIKNQPEDASTFYNILGGRNNYDKALTAKQDAELSDKDIIDQTEVEGIGDSGVFQKSDAYGKAMMRSGLYQKSYNAKKYK